MTLCHLALQGEEGIPIAKAHHQTIVTLAWLDSLFRTYPYRTPALRSFIKATTHY